MYGDPNAPVTIMEFGDYQCNVCKRFALFDKLQIDRAYIESGQAKLEFYDFPIMSLHRHAFLAARAVRCAGEQDRYFEYHDVVFQTQEDWFPMDNVTGHFNDLAKELQLDQRDFDACLKSDRYADVVSANLRLGQLMGVTGTPALFVHRGGRPVYRLGGSGFLDVQQAIEDVQQAIESGAEN